jgi:3-phenylpropionate/trans-cinnamate dioxygenase ferredoxin reductase subunit
MASQGRGVVVVGGGLAGATVAQTLREDGFDGSITVIGEETQRPYERPALSKDYLQDKTSIADLYVHPADWYADHQVQTRLGQPAVAVDRSASEVRLAAGETVPYDRLVLATGAAPRTLQLPGADLRGVHVLRRIEDADVLHAALVPDTRWVIIGAGWIGLEVAAAARLAGCSVTVLETGEIPLRRALGRELGQYFAQLHRHHGVTLCTGVSPRAILGAQGQAVGVETDQGTMAADVVLVAVGVTPNTRLASTAGIEVDNGIVVDEHLRSTDPTILAVGDVANAWHPVLGRRIRVEHWDNAIRQGRLAAGTLLGRPGRYDWQPYFYTDQYDLGMEYVGHSEPDDHVVVRGDLASGAFLVFWTRREKVTAAMNVNTWDVNDQLRSLLGRRIPAEQLGDPAIGLDSL